MCASWLGGVWGWVCWVWGGWFVVVFAEKLKGKVKKSVSLLTLTFALINGTDRSTAKVT